MNNGKMYFTALIALLLSWTGLAQATYKVETFMYAEHGKQKLYLDKITGSKKAKSSEKSPVIIYLFGGGWEGGDRNIAIMEAFVNNLTSQGYTIIAIDYRLGVKEAKENGSMNASNGTQTYLKAIDIAVEDLYLATNFVLKNQKQWNIDPTQIVLLGGSSGATTSVVAEYGISNSTPLSKKLLPADFNYAGVISMAGALWLDGEHTQSVWSKKPCPFLFFIGNKDQVVTYDESHVEGFAGYGGNYLSKQLTAMGVANWFYDYVDGDHLVAAMPVLNRQEEITIFLRRFVKEKQGLYYHTIEKSAIPTDFPHSATLLDINGGKQDKK